MKWVEKENLGHEQNLRSMNHCAQSYLLPSPHVRILQKKSPVHVSQQWPSIPVTGCMSKREIRVVSTPWGQTLKVWLCEITVLPPPWLFFRSRHLKKMTEEYPTLPQGAEASLPLTGSASCGVPSLLRKMWTRHKKKAEYVGATNCAFEAD